MGQQLDLETECMIREIQEKMVKHKVKATYLLATIGSKTDNGGEVITATGGSYFGDLRLARVGDKVLDPIHGETEIVSGSGNSLVDDGLSVAIVGSETSSGARIISSLQDGAKLVIYEDDEPIPGFLEKGYLPPAGTVF